MFRKIADCLWVQEDSFKMMGARLGVRMTIAKLSSGQLWVHSPTALDPELRQKIDLLGNVAYIVGPSNGHNIWLPMWQESYPQAKILVSSGIPKKQPSLVSPVILSREICSKLWGTDFDHIEIGGVPFFSENIFFHKLSKSLIVTDLIQDHRDGMPSTISEKLVQGVLFKLLGFRGLTMAPPLKFPGIIKDRKKFKDSLQEILSWDFERVVVTHGPILEHDAKPLTIALMSKFGVRP